MEAKSYEEGLAKIVEMVKRLQSTLLLHQSKLEESFRRARQGFSLAFEKFHRWIKEAIKEEINQEGQVDFLGVQLNQRSPNRKGLKKMKQFRIDQLEANLERFKIDQAAINSEAAKQWAFLQATIEKNKVEADRQFAEIMNALKALQPPTTLPATIPHFEENRRQSFSGKEVKDNCFKGAHVTEVADECGGKNLPLTDSTFKDLDTEDICTCVGVLESANSQDSTNPTWAGDQSRIREKDVPSHGPRKRHLGGQIFGLELIIGLHCDPGRGEDRVTWNPGINYHPSERKWNFCLNSFIESNIMNNHVFQHFRPDDRHERRAVKRRVWDPGITGAMTKINDVEANLEQFKSETLAWQKETSNRFDRMQESIDKNKADADRQFAEMLQLLKALQPPTTLPATIPRFEENSGQCFSSDEVEKEELILTSAVDKGDFTSPILAVKEDLGKKLIDDLDEPLMVLESDGVINKNEFAVVALVVAVAPIVVAPVAVAPIVVAPIAVAPIAPVVVTPVEPSFILLGRKIKQNQAEQKLGCEICLQEPVPAQRRTWDPGITQYDVMEQHLEDKVFLGAGVLI
ncbi:hypothetical protein Tco_0654092 [Tanacetum coccineum]|uniref:Uncharacterized protein n=1 Tax=Tanacetum coccineum TaxID=301880 RepID=A0ABQ4X288_9ASTR